MVTKSFSTEDGNLSSSSIVSARTIYFKDIDLSMELKTSGDVYKKTHASAVKQSVKNIIMTNFYEKPFDPFFGANISGLLFELANDLTGEEITLTLGNENAFTNVKAQPTGIEIGPFVIGDYAAGISIIVEPTGVTSTVSTGIMGINAWAVVDPGTAPTWTVVDIAA